MRSRNFRLGPKGTSDGCHLYYWMVFLFRCKSSPAESEFLAGCWETYRRIGSSGRFSFWVRGVCFFCFLFGLGTFSEAFLNASFGVKLAMTFACVFGWRSSWYTLDHLEVLWGDSIQTWCCPEFLAWGQHATAGDLAIFYALKHHMDFCS